MIAGSASYQIGSDLLLEQAVARGDVVIGRCYVYRNYNNNLTFVRSAKLPCDVLLNTSELRGPALHSDVVAVELLPLDEWQQVAPRAPAFDGSSSDGEDDGADGREQEDDDPHAMQRLLPDGRPILQLIPPETPEEVIRHAAAEVALAVQMNCPSSYNWPPQRRPVGRVIRILRRHLPLLHVARIAENQVQPGQALRGDYYYRFRPFNALYPQLAVQGCDIEWIYQENINNSLFSLALQYNAAGELLTPPQMKNILLCKVNSFLGDASSTEVASHAICTSCEVPTEPFSAEAEAGVRRDFAIPSAAELVKMRRRDLRQSEFVCTVDPSTARDLDDALSIRRRRDGGYHVGVHIADVSYFVERGSALDEEARQRSNSTYLVDRVIAMLPAALSEQHCSLNPGEDKFAFSALFEFDRDGQLISRAQTGEQCEWFGQSVIRSRCRLAYEQAQQILDGDDSVELDVAQAAIDLRLPEEAVRDKVKRSIKDLHKLAGKLRRQSMQDGRLAIGNCRLAFQFDRNVANSPPISFFIQEQIEANWLVEEFMLLANQRVAQKIVQFIPNGALLRRHKPPESRKMARFRSALSQHELPMCGSSGQELQRLVDTIKKDHKQDFYTVCEILKYSLMAAEYIANDPTASDIRSHFAVAAPWYTHFTSPIRRYCDLMVHRQLLVALELERRMMEEGLEMPSVPHPAVEPKAGQELFDPALSINVESLETRDLFYSQSDIENITMHANTCRLNSRNAGDMSLEYFLCLYLLALQRKAKDDATLPQRLYTRAAIVKMTEGCFLLYSSELASEVEIGFKDSRQRFVYQGMVAADAEQQQVAKKHSQNEKAPAMEAERKIDEKAKAHARKKGGKYGLPRVGGIVSGEAQKQRSKVPTASLTAQVLWGANPETAEEEIEMFRLFTEVVVLVEVTAKQGRLSLGMLILPPWERAAALRACPKVPTSLIEA